MINDVSGASFSSSLFPSLSFSPVAFFPAQQFRVEKRVWENIPTIWSTRGGSRLRAAIEKLLTVLRFFTSSNRFFTSPKLFSEKTANICFVYAITYRLLVVPVALASQCRTLDNRRVCSQIDTPGDNNNNISYGGRRNSTCRYGNIGSAPRGPIT